MGLCPPLVAGPHKRITNILHLPATRASVLAQVLETRALNVRGLGFKSLLAAKAGFVTWGLALCVVVTGCTRMSQQNFRKLQLELLL